MNEKAEGREEAFESFYRAYGKRVYNYVYGTLLTRESAEDVTADVFIALWEHMERFQRQEDIVRPWLFAVARNMTLNWRKKAGVLREILQEEVPEESTNRLDWPGKDRSLSFPDDVRTEHILQNLSQEERELLSMRYGFALTNAEIAGIKDVSENAVKLRFFRLLAKCRKLEDKKSKS